MASDLLSVLEAAYEPAESDEKWLSGVVAAVAPLLDHGKGVVGAFYELLPSGHASYSGLVPGSPAVMEFLGVAGRLESEPNTESLSRSIWRAPPYGTTSQKSGLGAGWPKHPAIAKHHVAIGVRDTLGLIGEDPSGKGCLIVVPLRRVYSPPNREADVWSRVAAHIASGLRLRRAADEAAFDEPEAIVSPSGRIEHASGPAKSREALAAIARAARAMDRARGKLRRRDPDEAISIWRGLVVGRWSLVDSFDYGGRRHLIARRNDVTTPAWKALTARERQIVAYAALGHSNKLIAYELGLSLSTVAMHLSRAAARVGARSRVELITTYTAARGAKGSRR
jgi:DNA-binding CsgD family transcriptional regulator